MKRSWRSSWRFTWRRSKILKVSWLLVENRGGGAARWFCFFGQPWRAAGFSLFPSIKVRLCSFWHAELVLSSSLAWPQGDKSPHEVPGSCLGAFEQVQLLWCSFSLLIWLDLVNLEECPRRAGGQVLAGGVGLTCGVPGSRGYLRNPFCFPCCQFSDPSRDMERTPVASRQLLRSGNFGGGD